MKARENESFTHVLIGQSLLREKIEPMPFFLCLVKMLLFNYQWSYNSQQQHRCSFLHITDKIIHNDIWLYEFVLF